MQRPRGRQNLFSSKALLSSLASTSHLHNTAPYTFLWAMGPLLKHRKSPLFLRTPDRPPASSTFPPPASYRPSGLFQGPRRGSVTSATFPSSSLYCIFTRRRHIDFSTRKFQGRSSIKPLFQPFLSSSDHSCSDANSTPAPLKQHNSPNL